MPRDDERRFDLRVAPDGRAAFEGRTTTARLREHPGGFRLVPSPPDLLLLRRVDRDGPWMAGEVADRATLLELLQLVANAGWAGEFLLVAEGVRRAMVFDRGVIVAARSTVPAERLGEVIYRRGRVSRAVLDSVVGSLGPDRRIGETLVDLGALRPGDVYAMLQVQAEEIFYAALQNPVGAFSFVHGLDAAALPARLNLQAGRLLMEGLQRLDEESNFRARIPDASVVPTRTSALPVRIDPSARAIFDRIDGARTLADLARDAGLGEFEATRALHGLLSSGIARLVPLQSAHDAVLDLADGVNETLRDVHATADRAGIGAEARATIRAFVEGVGVFDVLFAGAGPAVDGSLDPARMAANVGRIGTDDPLAVARQALHDYVTFALFAAGTVLRREEHQALARRVQEALARFHGATR